MNPSTHLAAVLTTILACALPTLAQTAPAPTTLAPQTPTPSKPAVIPAAAKPTPRPDQWWTDRHAAIVERVKQGGHQTVFLGDSITEGWGGAGKEVWVERFGGLHPVNCGIGGDRTQHVLARLDDGLLDALAARNNSIGTVVLLIGTNNTSAPADSAEDIAAGVHEIVQRLRAKLPDARIVLMAIFPRSEKPNAQRNTITRANTLIRTQNVGENIILVDLGPSFLNDKGEIPKDLMPDFLHLSEAGYRVWADGIKNHISKPAPK